MKHGPDYCSFRCPTKKWGVCACANSRYQALFRGLGTRLSANKYCFFLLLPVFSSDDVSQKVLPSPISTYHGGAYPQISLSFLALHKLAISIYTYIHIYIYGHHDDGKFNGTIYMVTTFRGLKR